MIVDGELTPEVDEKSSMEFDLNTLLSSLVQRGMPTIRLGELTNIGRIMEKDMEKGINQGGVTDKKNNTDVDRK